MGGSVDWCFMGADQARPVRAGDLVSADAGGLPIYQVVSLAADRVWVRDLDGGGERLTPLSDFHWQALPTPA